MPPPNANATADGVSTIRRGMNAGVAPRMLALDQLAFAINVTNRGGLPKTRPVLRKVPLVYQDVVTQGHATKALWQKAAFYQAYGSRESCLVASIGGRLFRYLVGSSNAVQDISLAGDLNSSINPNCWMWQGEDFLIVNDGAALPLIFDGAGLRRSKGLGNGELPSGCMGAYVQGRNWVVLPDDNYNPSQNFMAGDLVYSHESTGPFNGRDAVLKTTENSMFSGGGAFSVPVNAGPITSMFSVGISDTSLGQGPLQVGTANSIFSVQVPFLRDEWATTQYPLMTVGLPNYGPTGSNAVTPINGDAWYRALDGIRSYTVARRDFNTWVNTPLSVEVEPILSRDTGEMLSRASVVQFDNRLLVTCSPVEVERRGIVHYAVVALDFNNISTLTTRSDPVYDGLWTGIPILQLVKGMWYGVERCFAFALDPQGDICLYEVMKDASGYYHDYNGVSEVGVECSLESRAMGWGDGGNKLKELQVADLYLERLAGAGTGQIAMDFKYRSDEDPCWKDWHDFELCAPIKDCNAGCGPLNVREQYRTYLRLPNPSDECSPVTNRRNRTGYEFQVRMAWKGFLQLNRAHFWSRLLTDSVVTSCPTSETCKLVKCCDLPWFSYRIEVAGGDEGGPVGWVWEDPTIWIGTEVTDQIIRDEEQPQWGVPVSPPPPPVMPPSGPGAPSWPILPPFVCPGVTTWPGPIEILDPISGFPPRFVAIPAGILTPADYMNAYGAAGALDAWAAEVWSQFLAASITYSQARIIWQTDGTAGQNWNAIHVFPGMIGGYPLTNFSGLDQWTLGVMYCP